MKSNQTSLNATLKVLTNGFVAQAFQVAQGNVKTLKTLKTIIGKRTARRGQQLERDIKQACKIIASWTN